MVNNHGDRRSPRPVVIPLPTGLFMAYKLVTKYLLTGMILQVEGGGKEMFFCRFLLLGREFVAVFMKFLEM